MKKYTYSDDLVQIAEWLTDSNCVVESKFPNERNPKYTLTEDAQFINTSAYKYRLVEEVSDEEQLPEVGEMVLAFSHKGDKTPTEREYRGTIDGISYCKGTFSTTPWHRIERIPKEVPEKKVIECWAVIDNKNFPVKFVGNQRMAINEATNYRNATIVRLTGEMPNA